MARQSSRLESKKVVSTKSYCGKSTPLEYKHFLPSEFLLIKLFVPNTRYVPTDCYTRVLH